MGWLPETILTAGLGFLAGWYGWRFFSYWQRNR